MGMDRETFRRTLLNVWSPTENALLREESIRYVSSLPTGVRPQRGEMAQYCKVALPGRTLSAIENHLNVMGYWRSHRRNNKPKRRKVRVSSGRIQSTRRTLAGKVKIVRSFVCPGCGQHSEVV